MTTEETNYETVNVSLEDISKGVIPTKATEPNQETEQEQPAPVTEEKPTTEETKPEELQFKDEDALSYLKSKGFEIETLEDLKKTSEVKEVNPYEDILDDDDRAYLNYKKETGRSRKEFDSLNVNWDEADVLVLARERLRNDTKTELSDEEADELIAEKLGIADFEELSNKEKAKLSEYAETVRNERKAEQEKYRTPKEEHGKPKSGNETKEEWLDLENGTRIKKQDYEKIVNNHKQHIELNKEAVNSVTDSEFKIKVDDDGLVRELSYKYEFSNDDRHSMVSITEDTTKYINENYVTDKGFDRKRFNEDMWWSNPKNREKAFGSLIQSVRAEAIEEVLKERGNVNLSPQTGLPKPTKEGVKMMSLTELYNS